MNWAAKFIRTTVDLSTIVTEEEEPTEDITTELVKENPFRYAGYYWDRKTQYYYLQARYYDPRPARFISEDTYEGEIDKPLSLNQYVYVMNNTLTYIDPTGRYCESANGSSYHLGACTSPSSNWYPDKIGREIMFIKEYYNRTPYADVKRQIHKVTDALREIGRNGDEYGIYRINTFLQAKTLSLSDLYRDLVIIELSMLIHMK